ncbi:lysozyme family protein [Rhodovulum strictum]|uniref:Uncharacterized protein n=1 Tax=Rhodovulum strictum TaxID=58314 RepID=A0A844BGY4_9RHOB|nr:hypothetical protein [Rhodovulum strictum]MRH20233.1 hypothetical protein [Rhodovulum strictum]
MPLRRQILALALLAVCNGLASMAAAQAVSLLGEGGIFGARSALVPVMHTPPDMDEGAGPSLFAGREGASLFAPGTPRAERSRSSGLGRGPSGLRLSGTSAFFAEAVRDLIARAEAGSKGYDAVQHGARIPPPRRPTEMTIGEIYAWIKATPRQPHAIGRYQFIPSTLRRLVNELGIDERTRFSPEVQNRLADLLLEEAGMGEFLAGRMDRRSFMNNLARIWAGFPNSSGKSHYHGYAGNSATMSWAQFSAHMDRIFPG